jgi:UDPglucose 6-dehydrogenase
MLERTPSRIGVVGLGVVGSAVYAGLSGKYKGVATYDILYNKDEDDFKRILECQVVFLCLPSLNKEDGSQDLSAIHSTCQKLKDAYFSGTVILKSTVLPGTCSELASKYRLALVHNPEFLTAAAAFQDFMAQKVVLLSGGVGALLEAERCYRYILPNCEYITTHLFEETELAKYYSNCLLATKVIFANEMHELCTSMGVKYGKVRSFAVSQGLIGDNHTYCPGPDGAKGFGGVCFPKDTQALLAHCESIGVEMAVLKAAVEKNKLIRSIP